MKKVDGNTTGTWDGIIYITEYAEKLGVEL